MSLFKPRQAYTLREACADALADAYQKLRSPRAYRAHIPHLLGYFGEQTPLGTITNQAIEAYLIQALDRWSRNTVRHQIAFLSRTFSLAERLGKVESNPCRLVRKPRPGDPRRVWLSMDQVHQLLRPLTLEDRFCVIFFLYTGLRKMEGFNLLTTDVNLDQAEIHVAPGKNARPRWIPIKAEFGVVLREFLLLREGCWLLAGSNNRKQAGDAFYNRFKRALKGIGLGEVVLHDLRRTCATWLLKEGVDVSTIRDWLGHSSLAVTEIYARVESGNMHRAAGRMAWVGDMLEIA